jgi:hypothetical protein
VGEVAEGLEPAAILPPAQNECDPPRRYGDLTRGDEHVGSYGQHRLGTTQIINASLVDEDYRPVNPVITIEL